MRTSGGDSVAGLVQLGGHLQGDVGAHGPAEQGVRAGRRAVGDLGGVVGGDAGHGAGVDAAEQSAGLEGVDGAAGRQGAGERHEPGGAAAGGVHAPQGFAVALAQPHLGGDGPGQSRADRAGGVGGEAGEGGVFDQVADGDGQSASRGHQGHADGGQGAAADPEEVVVDADPGQAQHLAPDLGEDPLGGGGGGDVRGLVLVEFGGRQGQRPPVDLSAAVDGHLVEEDETRGHHVGGQCGAQGAAQLLGVCRPVSSVTR